MQKAHSPAAAIRIQVQESRNLYKLVKAGGSDAEHFLQGQFTQDLQRLSIAGCLPAACCNAKGRVIATLRILALDDALGIVVPASLAEPLLERLTMYRLRADVSLEMAGPGWTASAVKSDADREALRNRGLLPDPAMNACRRDGSVLTIATGADYTVVEVFGESAAIAAAGLDFGAPLTAAKWQAARIQAGSADITAANSEKYTPHMLNLDLTGAVSFDKGCYTGQEIVARTEHLGNSRRRLMHYLSETPIAAIGDRLSCNDQPAAEVVNVAGRELLALGPVAQHGQTLQFRGTVVSPADLPYAIPVPPD